jgi:hypothetical protein
MTWSSCLDGWDEERREITKRYDITKKLNILESYHYIGKNLIHVERIRADKKKIFLDSGAFSMFTQGVEVNLDAYGQFIRENQDIIKIASNLDHIGRNAEEKSYFNRSTLKISAESRFSLFTMPGMPING